MDLPKSCASRIGATRDPPTFRQHDQVPTDVPSSIYRQLCREWVQLNALTSSETTVRRWGRLEPALAGHIRPSDIVDAIDAATPTRQNEMLAALTRLLQAGHQLAGRVVLQAMLPKLVRITLRTSATSSDNAWTEDRHHITLAEFWDVLATYPLHRRPDKIASNLALDTLHRVSGVRRPEPDIPLDPTELSTSMPNRFRTIDDPAQAIELSPPPTWRRSSPGASPDRSSPPPTAPSSRRYTSPATGRPDSRTPRKPGASPKRQSGSGAAALGADSPTQSEPNLTVGCSAAHGVGVAVAAGAALSWHVNPSLR